jgi:hypothetical protein
LRGAHTTHEFAKFGSSGEQRSGSWKFIFEGLGFHKQNYLRLP